MNRPRQRRARPPGRRSHHRRAAPDNPIVPLMMGAAAVGAVVGLGSLAIDEGPSAVLGRVADALDNRARKPQPGDSWSGCNDARARGTAPIYRGEPGYRDDMDGDGDGVACEPYY